MITWRVLPCVSDVMGLHWFIALVSFESDDGMCYNYIMFMSQCILIWICSMNAKHDHGLCSSTQHVCELYPWILHELRLVEEVWDFTCTLHKWTYGSVFVWLHIYEVLWTHQFSSLLIVIMNVVTYEQKVPFLIVWIDFVLSKCAWWLLTRKGMILTKTPFIENLNYFCAWHLYLVHYLCQPIFLLFYYQG